MAGIELDKNTVPADRLLDLSRITHLSATNDLLKGSSACQRYCESDLSNPLSFVHPQDIFVDPTGAEMEFSDIKRLAASGESEIMEFKTTTGERSDAARTLSAMLNGQGGSVIFGVRPDGKVIGRDVADKTLEEVTAACGETIYPGFPPSIERIEVPGTRGRQVLVARVPSGNMKPYTYKGHYLV